MAKTPAIPMYNDNKGTFAVEGNSLQYHAVIPGTDDHQVKELTTGSSGDGIIISGVLQEDALDGENAPVIYKGPTWGFASGAIVRDNVVEAIYSATAAENGRFKAISGAYAAAKMLSGIALEDAVDGAKFKLDLTRHVQVATS